VFKLGLGTKERKKSKQFWRRSQRNWRPRIFLTLGSIKQSNTHQLCAFLLFKKEKKSAVLEGSIITTKNKESDLSCHERSKKNILKSSACRLRAHTTIPTDMFGSVSMSIAGEPFNLCQAFSGFLTSAHHAYAFLL